MTTDVGFVGSTRLRVNATVTGSDKADRLLNRLSGAQMRQVQVAALIDGAHHVRRAMIREMDRVFDRPTPYIKRTINFDQSQISQRLWVQVYPRAIGSDMDPQKILNAQAWGGTRNDKRFESALKRAGILPSGYQAVLPTDPVPGTHDGRGNFTGQFAAQIISYLQASGEQGYRANMKAAAKKRIHSGKGFSGPVRKGELQRLQGRVYFVSLKHRPPGIWAAWGGYGPGANRQVRPAVVFARIGRYRPRYDTDRIAKSANVSEYMAKRLRYQIYRLAESGGM